MTPLEGRGPCSDCGMTLVAARTFKAATKEQRAEFRAQGFTPHASGTLCNKCQQRGRWQPNRCWPEAEVAFTGGWRRKGLISLPTGVTAAERLDAA